MKSQEKIINASSYLLEALQGRRIPETAIILGTGLRNWVDTLIDPLNVPYIDLPDFPKSTVETHTGRFVHAWSGSTPLMALEGRFHLYEGYTAEQVSMGVRVLGQLGIKNLILTNAAGAINQHFSLDSIMVIEDQINMTGQTPLLGENIPDWGPRFPDMSLVYDPKFQCLALDIGISLGLRLERGVYLGVMGPQLETPAETRLFRRMGADAIGMSTIIEAIAAKHMGFRLLGLSCLTNKNLPDCMQETSFEEIVSRAERTGQDLGRLLNSLVPNMS
ncbi:MAG TPA: purine-nucleoside phosphorylase [Desulfohalobiaceae bacterium]|nr:purine-nucleoside phosphorylase [Desulfohalobiaceae bacterium]